MSDLLDDRTNLLLLQEVCAGNGLEINLSYMSKRFNKHRNTIRERTKSLFSHQIVDRPVVPFLALFRERPLLVAVYADLPEDAKVTSWIREDTHIFGAYRIRDGDYNMMMFEFHEDVSSYQNWRDTLVSRGMIPDRRVRTPSSALYLPNKHIKYDPNATIDLLEEETAKSGAININGYVLDKLAVNVLRSLLEGNGVRMNENFLAKKIGIHRSTIRKRIKKMQEEGLIHHPLCRFPLFFTPSNYLLVFSMLEVREPQEFLSDISKDPHVSLAHSISEGKYNVLLFEAQMGIDGYLRWESKYENKYPGCLGSIKNTYLSPGMNISIDQQKVSLGIIRERLERIERERMPKSRSPSTNAHSRRNSN